MLLYVIRHGDPDYPNNTLTPQGFKQADALAKRLSVFGLDEIYTSSLPRAYLTAKPTAEALGIEPVMCDWAKEDVAWRYFTVPYDEVNVTWAFFTAKYNRLFNRPEVLALGRDWASSPLFEDRKFKEGVEVIQKSVDDFLLSLGYKHDPANGIYTPVNHNDKRVALFCHQGFGIAFLSMLLDIPYPLYASHFDIGHSGMTVVEFSLNSEGLVIPKTLQHSNDSHLYKEGLPTKYQNAINI